MCVREKAGGQRLASMLAAAESGELDAGDARGWLTRMAAVLRDETSGICFRDLHGFTTTGSQLSWIPPPGEQAATLCARACNPICSSLQPHLPEPATLSVRACSPICSSLQPYLFEPATLVEPALLDTAARRAGELVRVRVRVS